MPHNDYIQDYLMHYGILGQKWGVRRYQNADGSLTSAGQKRYNVDISAAKKRYRDAQRRYNSLKTKSSKNDLRYFKRELQNEKIKEKLNNKKKISPYQQKIQQKYINRGMSEEDAAIAAYKNIRAKKIAAAIIGTTVAAAATYVAVKEYDKRVDKIISKDKLLSRIATSDSKSVHDGFYAAFEDKDISRYKGLLGGTRHLQGFDVYQKRISLKSDLKIASRENARRCLQKIVSEGDNSQKIVSILENHKFGNEKLLNVYDKAINSVKSGIVDENVYNAFNASLTEGTKNNSLADSFYNALKKSGYDAIEDVNDKIFSGYRAKSPAIIFNRDKLKTIDVSKLPVSSIQKDFFDEQNKLLKEMTIDSIKDVTTKYGGLSVAGIGGASIISSAKDSKIIKQYRKEHPNTKLTNNEILRNANS